MPTPAEVLQQVLSLFWEEEQALAALMRLALDEQQALVESDFDAVAGISNRMIDAANSMNLLRSVGAEALTLEDLLPLADDLGVDGFAEARLQLGARARELRDAQEQNARLLLNAMKLRDRWANMLGGYLAPGYGSNGRRGVSNSRGTVSRSA